MTGAEHAAGPAQASAPPARESERVGAARLRAGRRVRRQRATLRPLGLAAMVLVVGGSAGSHPSPGLRGEALAVTLALCAFAAALAIAVRDRFPERRYEVQAAVIATMGAAGVALAALQSRGAGELAAGVAVFMAVARLPLVPGVALGALVTAALAGATTAAGSSAPAVLAGALLCVLLGLVARFAKQARESQDQTELLLAQLEDARDEQARAAAVAERGRIASELHDVLAHSLSGAAIQLQGARMLAEREHAAPPLREAIDRAGALVRAGLADARRAVGALRGDALPGVAQLASLVESFRTDMHVDVTLCVEGDPMALSADRSLALYRGAQEALTNVARYAPGASVRVLVRYGPGRTILRVENRAPVAAPAAQTAGGLAGAGGGRGLAGMRERTEAAGGTMRAGPTPDGWRVELEVPV
ncbi:MAG: sensor histidine kinase [Solirubrobacteraceae bacterium]